jgi:outer membrane protein
MQTLKFRLATLLGTMAVASLASAQTIVPAPTNALPSAVSTNPDGQVANSNVLQILTNFGPVRPISLQECFDMALKNNLSLQIERLNPLLKEQALYSAKGYYDPTIGGSYSHSHSASGGSYSQGITSSAYTSDTDTFSGSPSSVVSGRGPFGLSYGISASTSETDATVPSSSSSIRANVTQPLLKDFLYNSGQYNIDLAKNDIRQSKHQLVQQIMTTLNQVEQAYYDLMFARQSIVVQQMGFELATRLLDENRKKVQIGVLAPLDERQAESQVAARQTDLASALRTFNTAQNNLKKLLSSSYRELHDVRVEPTISLVAVPSSVDLHESWGRALSQRPDLLEERLVLERQNISLKYNKTQLLPELDITGSYGYVGSGGAFNNSLSDLSGTQKANWSAGASVSFPIGNRAAKGRFNQSKLSVDQALLTLKSKEESILVQVDEDVNQLRTAWAQVSSSKAARIYAEDALDAEQKKLEAGKSTSFVVLQLQNELTSARYNEISALANYNKAQSQLSFDEGQTLKRHSINVDIK